MGRYDAGAPSVARKVNGYLKAKLNREPERLYEAAAHLIVHGGKRLRPYMTIKSCQLLGGDAHNAMPAAGAVELIHNFTLVHDDIMDNDDMRHGVKTVHKKFGLPTAILAGDVLYSKAYQIAAESGLPPADSARLISRLAKACVDVCEGQSADMSMSMESRIPSEREYIAMIRKKTAALFDVSCAMGAICAGGPGKDVSNLSSFGRNLGVAFQITDDIMGVMGDPGVTKKPVGNDLRDGKKSLPILMAIKASKGGDRKSIMAAFGNKAVSDAALEKAVGVMRTLGIEDQIRGAAQSYARRAERSLAPYSGPVREELAGLLDFVVKRSA